MTPQERRDYYNQRGMEVHRQIQERKLQKVWYVNWENIFRLYEDVLSVFGVFWKQWLNKKDIVLQ